MDEKYTKQTQELIEERIAVKILREKLMEEVKEKESMINTKIYMEDMID